MKTKRKAKNIPNWSLSIDFRHPGELRAQGHSWDWKLTQDSDQCFIMWLALIDSHATAHVGPSWCIDPMTCAVYLWSRLCVPPCTERKQGSHRHPVIRHPAAESPRVPAARVRTR